MSMLSYLKALLIMPVEILVKHDFNKEAGEIVNSMVPAIKKIVSLGWNDLSSIISQFDIEEEVRKYYKPRNLDPATIAMIVSIVVPIVIEILKVAIPLIIEAMNKKEDPAV